MKDLLPLKLDYFFILSMKIRFHAQHEELTRFFARQASVKWIIRVDVVSERRTSSSGGNVTSGGTASAGALFHLDVRIATEEASGRGPGDALDRNRPVAACLGHSWNRRRVHPGRHVADAGRLGRRLLLPGNAVGLELVQEVLHLLVELCGSHRA